MAKETTKMAEHIEKEKKARNIPDNSSSKFDTNGNGQNASKDDIFKSEEKRLTTLVMPRAEDWAEYYINGKLGTLSNQRHINSTLHIVKIKIVSCHNLRNSETTSYLQPFVTLIAPDMDKYEN